LREKKAMKTSRSKDEKMRRVEGAKRGGARKAHYGSKGEMEMVMVIARERQQMAMATAAEVKGVLKHRPGNPRAMSGIELESKQDRKKRC
jgi:hypothetical protein